MYIHVHFYVQVAMCKQMRTVPFCPDVLGNVGKMAEILNILMSIEMCVSSGMF